MVKDSRKYALTGACGFAELSDSKSADEAVHKPALPATKPPKLVDFVFIRYALRGRTVEFRAEKKKKEQQS